MNHRSNGCCASGIAGMLLVALAFTVSVAAASPLLVHMGSDEALRWTWSPEAPLRGALYRIVLSEKEAKEVAELLPASLQEVLAGIDFDRQAAFLAYLGETPSSGFAVDIHSVQVGNNEVLVNVSRKSPAKDEVVAAVMAHPVTVRTLPIADLPKGSYVVSFLDQNGRTISQRSVGKKEATTTSIVLGDDRSLEWDWNYSKSMKGATFELVTSRQGARKTTSKLPSSLRPGAFGGINFKKQVALLAYLGEAPNSGFAVDIHSVQIRDKEVSVKVTRRSPAQGEVNLQTVSYPMVIKSLSRKALPKRPFSVRFIDQNGSLLAEQLVKTSGTYRVLYHTVRPGETLWKIAWTNNVSVSDLMSWNQLTPHQNLHVGQQLKIVLP